MLKTIDDFDIKILKEFNKLKVGNNIETEKMMKRLTNYSDDGETPWNIMRLLFPQGKTREQESVIYKLKKMHKMGLFVITKNSPLSFFMIEDNVQFKKIKFPDKNVRDAVCLKINGKWNIIQL